MNNIILIGMPGAGKSTIGIILAKVLGYQFIDADLLIQEQEDKLLCDIIEEKGIEGFIEVENRVNRSIVSEKSVISTGGSAVYGKEAMQHLKEIGTVVYLKLGFEEISSRLNNIKNRGVVIRNGESLYDLYLERTPLYERYADIIVETDGCNIEEAVEKTAELIKSRNSH